MFRPDRLAEPKSIGGVTTVAGLFEVSEAMFDGLHRASQLDYPTVPLAALARLGYSATR